MSEPGKSPRQFSNAFKEAAVLRLEGGEKIAAVAAAIGVGASSCISGATPGGRLGRPGSIANAGGSRVGGPPRPARRPLRRPCGRRRARRAGLARAGKAQARIAELERVIGRQQADLHFFREALRLWDATSPNGGAPISTRSSKK